MKYIESKSIDSLTNRKHLDYDHYHGGMSRRQRGSQQASSASAVQPPVEEPIRLIFSWLSAANNAIAVFVSRSTEWVALPPSELATQALPRCRDYVAATGTTQGKITLRQFAAQLFPNDQDPSSCLPNAFFVVPLSTYLDEVQILQLNLEIRSRLKMGGHDTSHWSIP